jgi:hypothetical protein
MLIPLWGNESHSGYAKFALEGREFLKLTEPDEADFAILPFDGGVLLNGKNGPNPEAVSQARRFVDFARSKGLKTLVIVNADSAEPIPLPDVIVFRTALDKRTQPVNEYALPAWHEEIVAAHLGGSIVVRDYEQPPIVGFCGHSATSGPPLRRRIKQLGQTVGRSLGIPKIPDHSDGIFLRRAAIQTLFDSPVVRGNFIIREKCLVAFSSIKDLEFKARVRREYIDNLVGSDYILCVRGYGNFSFRFYEAMSVGRSPLLIDTHCVLPFDFLHDYNQYCVIVPENRLARSAEEVAKRHSRFSPAEYRAHQQRTRDFWVQWLSPHGFFRSLATRWRELPALA